MSGPLFNLVRRILRLGVPAPEIGTPEIGTPEIGTGDASAQRPRNANPGERISTAVLMSNGLVLVLGDDGRQLLTIDGDAAQGPGNAVWDTVLRYSDDRTTFGWRDWDSWEYQKMTREEWGEAARRSVLVKKQVPTI